MDPIVLTSQLILQSPNMLRKESSTIEGKKLSIALSQNFARDWESICLEVCSSLPWLFTMLTLSAFMPTLALTTDTKYDAIRLSKGDLRAIISQDENKAAWHEPNRPADNLYRSVSIKCNEAWEGLSINSLYNQRVALIPAKTNWNLGSDTEMTIQLKEKNAITREDEGEPLSTAKYLQDYADTYERLTKALCEESTNIRSKNLKLIHENDHLDKETKKLETKKRKLEEDKLAKDVAESERLQRERQELEAQKSIRWKEDRRLKKLSLRLKNEQKMLDKQWNEFQDKKEIFEEEKQQFEEGKLKLQKELHSLFPREIEEGN